MTVNSEFLHNLRLQSHQLFMTLNIIQLQRHQITDNNVCKACTKTFYSQGLSRQKRSWAGDEVGSGVKPELSHRSTTVGILKTAPETFQPLRLLHYEAESRILTNIELTPIGLFSLFWTDEILDNIDEATNRYMKLKKATWSSQWSHPTSIKVLSKSLGVTIMMGMKHLDIYQILGTTRPVGCFLVEFVIEPPGLRKTQAPGYISCPVPLNGSGWGMSLGIPCPCPLWGPSIPYHQVGSPAKTGAKKWSLIQGMSVGSPWRGAGWGLTKKDPL